MKRISIIALCFLITLIVTACTGTAPDAAAETAEPSAAEVPPRPDAPASGDTFRPDHPGHVASTGRPQLIEFFSFT